MAGFEETLGLNIGPAIAAISQVESRLTQASKQFSVAMASSVDALRGVKLEIAVDEGGIASSINSAVDAANARVQVTADTSQVTGAVSGAVDAADSVIPVTADTSAASAEIQQLGDELAEVANQRPSGEGVVGLLGSAAVFAGINRTLDAAAQLEQAIGGTGAAFRDAREDVDEFARGAADSVGLSERAAREVTTTIGTLLTGYGLSVQEAAEQSINLTRVGADLAATLGGTTAEAVNALAATFRNEFDTAERFGITLTATQVNARAVALGLAESTGAVDEYAKVQATLSLILEDAAFAQGQFVREFNSATGSQQRAAAAAENAAASFGDQLLPAVSAVSDSIGTLAGIFGLLPDVGQTALLSLLAVAAAAGPIGRLNAAIRTLTITSAGLASKTGILAFAVGAGLIFSKITDDTNRAAEATDAWTSALRDLTGGLERTAESAIQLKLEQEGLTESLFLSGVSFEEFTGAITGAEDVQEIVDRLYASLGDGANDLINLLAIQTAAFKDAAAGQISYALDTGTAASEILAMAEAAGFSVTQIYNLERALADGVLTTEEIHLITGDFGALLELLQTPLEGYADGLKNASISAREHADAAIVATQAIAGIVAAAGFAEQVLDDFASSASGALPDVGDIFSDIGKAATGAGQSAESASEKAGDAIANIAEKTADTIERLSEQAADRMERLVEQAQDAQEALEEALTPASARDVGRAELGVDRARQRQIEAEAALAEARRLEFSTEGGATVEERQRAIADAELDVRESTFAVIDAEERLAEVRAQGTEQDERVIDARERLAEINEDIARSERDLAEAIAEARADAVEAVEGAGSRIVTSARQTADEVEVSAARLGAALRGQAADLADFRSDLERIGDAGFSDLAALIAERGPEVGGALADELSDALAAGNRALLGGLTADLNTFNAEVIKTTDFFRSVLGPQFIEQSLFVGAAAAQGFGDRLDFEERIRLVMGLAESALSEEGRSVAAVAAAEGADAAQAWGEALDLDQETIDAAIAAGQAIVDNAPLDQARDAGGRTGDAFVEGVDEAFRRASAAEMENYIELLESNARRAAEANSPSKLFMRLGADMGEGLLLGIDSVAAKARVDSESFVAKVSAGFEARSGSVSGPAVATLDDSRIVAAIQAAARDTVRFDTVNFYNEYDAGRKLDQLRQQHRRMQNQR